MKAYRYQNPFFWLPKKFNQQNKWSLCIFQWNIALPIAFCKQLNPDEDQQKVGLDTPVVILGVLFVKT